MATDIKPNELRIGNWIYDDESLFCKVIGMQPFGHSVRCDEGEGCEILVDVYRNDGDVRNGCLCESYNCSPIPINSEILEKAGFKKPENDCYQYGSILFWIDTGWLQLSLGSAPLINCPCKYVHQLQNLYVALYGTELKISL